MINISFEINGRKVRPDQIGDALERAMLDAIKDEIVQKITVRGRSLDDMSFEVTGSERLVKLVEEKFR